MTPLMIAFVILALVCMVLLNPASQVVDRVLITKKPWSLEAAALPLEKQINMACGTKIKLNVQGGSGDAVPYAQSSNPDTASISYEDSGLWLYTHQKGNVTVALFLASNPEKKLASLKINSITPSKVEIMLDGQKLTPGINEVYLPKQNKFNWLTYQWTGTTSKNILGVATHRMLSFELASDKLALGSTQHIGYKKNGSTALLTFMLMDETYHCQSISGDSGQMNICAKQVSTMDYFTKLLKNQQSVKIDLQIQSAAGKSILTEKEVTQPTEIRWRQGRGDYSAWTRPYEKDKPILYVVEQALDENNRWIASIILHPRIVGEANKITLQVRHRRFSDRSLSLQDSLFLRAYECSFTINQNSISTDQFRWL